MRLVITLEGDFVASQIVIGALITFDELSLTPLQCAVIFHTFSIRSKGGTVNAKVYQRTR